MPQMDEPREALRGAGGSGVKGGVAPPQNECLAVPHCTLHIAHRTVHWLLDGSRSALSQTMS